MAEKMSAFRPNLALFGVQAKEPGWLYIVKNGYRFKVGKTRNPKRRLKEARTWLPELEVVGVKPFWNITALERTLLCGFSQFACSGEWHRFPDDTYGHLLDDFANFYDEDRDMNSVDFGYWINSSGMGEIIMEYNSRRTISLRQWRHDESFF